MHEAASTLAEAANQGRQPGALKEQYRGGLPVREVECHLVDVIIGQQRRLLVCEGPQLGRDLKTDVGARCRLRAATWGTLALHCADHSDAEEPQVASS